MDVLPVTLTDKAIEKVREFFKKTPYSQGKYFRVAVEGGGCSGFQYKYSIDTKQADDLVIPCGDVEVIIDPQSKNLILGCKIDYIDDFTQSGFTVSNPQAKGTCGCGTSFTV